MKQNMKKEITDGLKAVGLMMVVTVAAVAVRSFIWMPQLF